MAPAPFSVVCFRGRFERLPAAGQDDANQRLMDAVNATGEAYMSHTRVRGRLTLRLAVANLRTRERHVRRAWELIQGEATRLEA
jgi:aromatic-L-amino-acid decarboxylase